MATYIESYTITQGQLAGVTLVYGQVKTHPEHGKVVDFERYSNETALKGRLPARMGVTLKLDTNPGLAELVAAMEAEQIREREEEAAADAARDAAAFAGCPEGHEPCRQKWSNGDLMSALYVSRDGVEVLGSDMLDSHGGWYYLPAAKIAEEAAALETKKAAAAAKVTAREAKLAEAKALAASSGKPVEIERWTDECDGSADECSMDLIVRFVRPDGSITTRRTHAH